MGWRMVVGGLADSAGLRSVHSQRCAAANAPDRMLWIPRIVLGLHRVADVRPAPGATAVVAGPGPLPGAGQHGRGGPGHDRALAAPGEDQAVGGERLEGVPDDAGPDTLQGAQLGDRRQLVARSEAA